MKDIGYYAGFLSADDQQAINEASINAIAGVITNLSEELLQPFDTSWLDIKYPDSDRDKLALIRGLCDRIEIKLMEAAK